MTSAPEPLLDAWFGGDLDSPEAVGARTAIWFGADDGFDALLRRSFGSLPDQALRGELADWRETPRSALALVIALDQLPRNLFRDTPRAFAYDAAALDVTREALARGFDARLHPVEATFLYLPLEHAEDPGLQDLCVERFRTLVACAPAGLGEQFESFLAYAERHHAVIERFGRFPHRNRILGRASTPDEIRYLEEGGETFGGAKDA